MSFRKVTISGSYYVNADFDTKGVIRIKNDTNLKTCLNKYGAYKIANECRYIYSTVYGKQIDIRTTSLALEIVGHVYPGDLFKILNQLPLPSAVKNKLDSLITSTSVVDCGESNLDSNRWVWDVLTGEFYYAVKELIN